MSCLPLISNLQRGWCSFIVFMYKSLQPHGQIITILLAISLMGDKVNSFVNRMIWDIVCKMLGHKKMQIAQHYAKILDKRVSDDTQSLREKFKPQLKIADADTGS